MTQIELSHINRYSVWDLYKDFTLINGVSIIYLAEYEYNILMGIYNDE